MSIPNPPSDRQPVFNLPGVVLALLGALIVIHAARQMLLSPDSDFVIILTFAFIPLREIYPGALGFAIPGGDGARVWSFVTYALLHADWSHLIFNSLWLAAFGSPLAWRFGAARFLLFSAVGAVAGAALHLAVYPQAVTPMIGASAAISAQMAGASRFVFASGGPLGGLRRAGSETYQMPAQPLTAVIADNRVLVFLGVWFGLNILFGLAAGQTGLASGPIAWDAHIGGFIAGLFLFPLFDPIKPVRH